MPFVRLVDHAAALQAEFESLFIAASGDSQVEQLKLQFLKFLRVT